MRADGLGPEGSNAPAAMLDALVAGGYARIEPAILQPASVFLDLSGEDIRGRLLLTSDADGGELCLRPEYTIPVCRAYLAMPAPGAPAAFSYCGPVFRQHAGEPTEFVQAGLESFGRTDREAADAEILTLALDAAQRGADDALAVRIGDTGLFTSLVDALDLPAAWVRRIRRGHMRGQKLDTILAPTAQGSMGEHAGVLAALSGVEREQARALVEDLLSIAGISTVGGRSAGAIADRFLEQAALHTQAGVSAEKRTILDRFLAIEGDPDESARALRTLFDDAGIDMHAALDSYETRLGFIAAHGLSVAELTFAAGFGRNLDYYTGFVFEARRAHSADTRLIVGGGRYDRLLRTLGAGSDIPAVGAAIWCARLLETGATP